MCRPVGGQSFTQLEEIDIDFRVFCLSHAVVKEAENLCGGRSRKSSSKGSKIILIEKHFLQQNVYTPFSENSQAMIRELGNVELFELCGTIPKVKRSHCFLYWSQWIVYCTVLGWKWIQKFQKKKKTTTGCSLYPALRHQKRALPWCWKRKNRRTEKKLKKPSTRGRDAAKELTLDQVYRESQLKIGWTEQKSIEMDELAQQDRTYRQSNEEIKRYQGQWYLTFFF